jgi:hypothetical protein
VLDALVIVVRVDPFLKLALLCEFLACGVNLIDTEVTSLTRASKLDLQQYATRSPDLRAVVDTLWKVRDLTRSEDFVLAIANFPSPSRSKRICSKQCRCRGASQAVSMRVRSVL